MVIDASERIHSQIIRERDPWRCWLGAAAYSVECPAGAMQDHVGLRRTHFAIDGIAV